MERLSGLGKTSRMRLGQLLRQSRESISVGQASTILGLTSQQTAKFLARLAKRGWLTRIRRGLYIPIPLESPSGGVYIEDAWIIAERLFSPCYIAGWSAAEYWGLTEQIFRTLIILTTQKPRKRDVMIAELPMLIRSISKRAFFGTKAVWRGSVKVEVSDPTKTIVDILSIPKLAGGIRPATDVLLNYWKSEFKNSELLIEYSKRLGNRTVFKRLGFLLEQFLPAEESLIKTCRSLISKGNSKLDPELPQDALVTSWRLWVPKQFREKVILD